MSGDGLFTRGIGLMSAGQMFSQSFMRHMYDYGTTPEQVAHVKVIHSEHASNNPKAYYKKRVSVDDVLSSRMIVKPLHLLDCCVETDNGTAIIVTSVDRALDCRHTPAKILSVVGRCSKPRAGNHYQSGPISTVAGGHLCEGYTHGVNMVIENVRQLRHDVDDSCPLNDFGGLEFS